MKDKIDISQEIFSFDLLSGRREKVQFLGS